MAEIKQSNGRLSIDYMARDYESLLRSMRELIPQKLPEWNNFESEADFGNVLLQLFAHMGDILSYYQDRVANESFLSTARTRRSVIEHLRLIGYRLATAAPATAKLSITVPGNVADIVKIRKGDAFATKSQKNSPSIQFEYTQDEPLEIRFDTITADKITGKKTFTGLPVEEGWLIRDEVLGTSDGSKNQRFSLAHPGLMLSPRESAREVRGDVVLITELESAKDSWTLQESLVFSPAKARDYEIEIDENDRATVIFGDGIYGMIPTNGATIKATYRVGGGLAGNVGANTIQMISKAASLAALSAKVTNPEPANGGAERESIEHAVRHAPAVFRTLKRAVTASDYESLALSIPGVGKVRAEGTNWNQVTLFVAPQGGGKVSDVLELKIKDYFENKRMLSQVIEVDDVDYISIYVTAEIGVESYFSPDDVKARVQQAAAKLLAFENVDFGQTVYLSKFYEVIEAVEGVQYANIKEFRRGDRQPDPADDSIKVVPSGKIELGPNEIPKSPDDSAYAGGLKVV
jgi:Uncharacterized homolog of phage Mu protein gp47